MPVPLRIKAHQTLPEMVAAIAGGNSGAELVLTQVLTCTPEIDPGYPMGGMGILMALDKSRIHDEQVWDLFKACGEGITNLVGCVRAKQLGIISDQDLTAAAKNQGRLNMDDIISQVEQRSSRFNRFAFEN